VTAMSKGPKASVEPTAEQVRYAAILEKGMRLGLLSLLVTFALYVSGVLRPYIPLDELDQHWTKKAHDYLADSHIEAGWGWGKMVGYGDFINFIGIAILGCVTVGCYLAIIPLLWKRKDTIYAFLALVEAVILILAASGIISVGH
jgi:hypothetical protein